LLELAVWKVVCMTITPTLPTASHDPLFWREWFHDGWKTHKETARKSNKIGIIIRSVLPFIKID